MTPIQTAARAIATTHGLDPEQLTELPGGVANHVFRLGSELILRIPRSPAFIPDLEKEAAVIPAARAAGVRTPAIVTQGTITVAGVHTPYLLTTRVHGNDLAAHASTPTAHPSPRAAHPSTPTARPGDRAAHPSAPTAHPDAATAHASSPAVHPSAPTALPGAPAAHPSAPAAHPSPRGAHLRTQPADPGSLAARPDAAMWENLGREVALLHRIKQASPASPRPAISRWPGNGQGSPGTGTPPQPGTGDTGDTWTLTPQPDGPPRQGSPGTAAPPQPGTGRGSPVPAVDGSGEVLSNWQVAMPEDSGAAASSAHELVELGYLDPETGHWLGSWMDELRERFRGDSPLVLLHGDLAPQNLMVDRTGRFVALIDWGDAAWGPRGMEFAKLRLEDVVRVLPAYKEAADVRFEPGELEAAVLWFHLQWGLSNLTGPPRLGERHWTATPTSRVLGVLRFLASDPPEPWDSLMTRQSSGLR
ncbi:phosphotransferase [Kribbella lupini]|uniref:Aminoglycoside phosphotransferase domain-containing protein n=1 Tax=Kribbella lupini TaxID=291602 RepID=A0ABN2B2A8_9ACTN